MRHFRGTLCLCFKTSPDAGPSYRDEFDLNENEPVSVTHFHMNSFARRLVLTRFERQLRSGLFDIIFMTS